MVEITPGVGNGFIDTGLILAIESDTRRAGIDQITNPQFTAQAMMFSVPNTLGRK